MLFGAQLQKGTLEKGAEARLGYWGPRGAEILICFVFGLGLGYVANATLLSESLG